MHALGAGRKPTSGSLHVVFAFFRRSVSTGHVSRLAQGENLVAAFDQNEVSSTSPVPIDGSPAVNQPNMGEEQCAGSREFGQR